MEKDELAKHDHTKNVRFTPRLVELIEMKATEKNTTFSEIVRTAKLCFPFQQIIAERIIDVYPGKCHFVSSVNSRKMLSVFSLPCFITRVFGDRNIILAIDIRRI